MLPTPPTPHVPFSLIYEPAEDTHLLLDTLSSPPQTRFLTARFPPPSPAPLILEVGTGSGVVLAFLAAHARAIFGRADVLALGTDVNGHACWAAGETVARAGSGAGVGAGAGFLGVVRADLVGAVRGGVVDVLVVNPPYVPTEGVPGWVGGGGGEVGGVGYAAGEEEGDWLEVAWAGGRDGLEVTNRLLEQVPRVLEPGRGVAYVLLCARNRPEEVKARIKGWGPGWDVETVGRSGKVGGWERLQVIRVARV